MVASDGPLGARRRERVWEGLAILCGGICLSLETWWVGVPLAATGFYLVMRSRRELDPTHSTAQ